MHLNRFFALDTNMQPEKKHMSFSRKVLGVSKNGVPQKWMVYMGKPY